MSEGVRLGGVAPVAQGLKKSEKWFGSDGGRTGVGSGARLLGVVWMPGKT